MPRKRHRHNVRRNGVDRRVHLVLVSDRPDDLGGCLDDAGDSLPAAFEEAIVDVLILEEDARVADLRFWPRLRQAAGKWFRRRLCNPAIRKTRREWSNGDALLPFFGRVSREDRDVTRELRGRERTVHTMSAASPFPVSVLQLDHQPIALFDAAKDRLLHMDWVIVTNHDQEESPSSTLTDLSCYIWQRRTIETPISDRRRTVKPQFPHGDHLKMLPNIV